MSLPKHSAYGKLDDKPLMDGDVAFTRMNMAQEPDLLSPGEYAFARNVRNRRGKPTTRRGVQRMTWAEAETPNTTPVYGSLSFRSPTGISYILKAREDHCEACDPTGGVAVIEYPEGVTLTSAVHLEQLFDRVLMCRGQAFTSLEWVPPSDWVDPFGTAFSAIAAEGVGGTEPIPNSDWAYSFKNRAIIPKGRDEIAASDVLNYTRYDPVAQQFKVNSGDEQSLKGAIKGGRNTLLAFKDYSVFALENFTGTLAEVTQDQLPCDVGLGARRTLVGYGTDIFFMGADLAIYNLAQALDNRLQGEEKAFSDPVEPMMESIKPTLMHKCVAKVWNKSMYVAIPVGAETETANVILVYDFGVGGWVSVDTSELFEIQNLIIYPYQGRQRLFFVHEDGNVYLMEEGYQDVGPDDPLEIPSEFISRGYSCGVEGRKRFNRAEVVISTWSPNYTIQSSANGGNV